MSKETEQNIAKNKPSHRKYIIGIVFLLLVSTGFFVLMCLKWEPKPDPVSEKVIRKIAAEQLGKDPNGLTDEDFAKIIVLEIYNEELSNIKLLEKFTNLQELNLNNLHYPQNAIPKWMQILAKLGVFDIEKRKLIDLRPIEKVSNLKKLDLSNGYSPVPIAGGTGFIFQVSSDSSPFQDIEPLSSLINLKELNLEFTKISDLKPIKDLMNLQKLNLKGTVVDDLKPLKQLTNLEQLILDYTQVSGLEPLKSLPKLQFLSIAHCNKITDEQVEDLQKALPKLTIDHSKPYKPPWENQEQNP